MRRLHEKHYFNQSKKDQYQAMHQLQCLIVVEWMRSSLNDLDSPQQHQAANLVRCHAPQYRLQLPEKSWLTFCYVHYPPA